MFDDNCTCPKDCILWGMVIGPVMIVLAMVIYIPMKMDWLSSSNTCRLFCQSRFSPRLTAVGPTLLFEGLWKAKSGRKRISLRMSTQRWNKTRQSVHDSIKQEFIYTYHSTKEYWQISMWFRAWCNHRSVERGVVVPCCFEINTNHPISNFCCLYIPFYPLFKSGWNIGSSGMIPQTKHILYIVWSWS